jgi:hypothetical protein
MAAAVLGGAAWSERLTACNARLCERRMPHGNRGCCKHQIPRKAAAPR